MGSFCRRGLGFAAAWLFLVFATLNCFTSEKSLPDVKGNGQISGKVVGPDGAAIPGVQITTTFQGKTLQTTSAANGTFTITVSDVERGQGFNIQFVKTNFENANQAAVISLPNLKVDIGNVTLYISGGSEVTSRKITGQVLDNFSYRPLVAANVFTVDSAGQAVVALTDDKGKFELTSNYFAMGSSFAVSAFKTNFIPRTDLVATITAEENTIRNSPIRLYQKFGSVYAYVTEDTFTPATALNNVTVALKNSNNQVLQCVTGVGKSPGGPYDPVPLAVGAYCPDLSGITSPISGTVGDNNGGIKMQNDFLLLGTRYDVTFTRTSTNCTNRNPLNTTGCYRTKTSFVDVNYTGDNPISGGQVAMLWDSWIYGSVNAGSGVTVKLYDWNNTYITETVTDGSGNFLLDHSKILRSQAGQPYKLTFEKGGYYSRLIGIGPPNDPVTIMVAAAGGNNAGAVTMTALPPPSHCISGTIKDYWSTNIIQGATVVVCQLVTPNDSNPDANCSATWSGTTNTLGQFNIPGNFTVPTVNAYMLKISKTNYTGEQLVSKHSFKFTHDTILQPGCAPYNLDTQPACSATGVGPSGGTNCVPNEVLYPIGIYAKINGTDRYFRNQIKQTYEKFLTEKNGLTISGRTGDLQLTSNTPQKTYDYPTIYLHFDDTPKVLPNVPEGKWSNHVPVNPMTPTCGPTQFSPCSPRANGALAEGIGDDTRTQLWDMKNYIYYHFYAAAPGTYTIETTGSTDTYMTVHSQVGALLGTDDDSGTGSNARIVLPSITRGWYYIKIRGKNNNVFGFFDVSVTGPVAAESNYEDMMKNIVGNPKIYSTNCAPNSGNLVVSYYETSDTLNSGSANSGRLLYIAAPGENGGCSVTAEIEKHGPIGDIIRGRFGGTLRPVTGSSTFTNTTVTDSGQFRGFFNIIRSE